MSDWTIVFTRTALKDIQKLDVHVAKRLQKKITHFIDSGEPLSFASQLFKPADAGYRWRVGDYRVLFDVDEHGITVLKVQHRREVYRK